MEEIWIDVDNKGNRQIDIVKLSNIGRMMRRNGSIEIIPLRHTVFLNKKHVYAYRILAEHFIPKTEEDIELGRDHVDHIMHNPINLNVNDIRNLRWCTKAENLGFKEARENMSKAHKGKKTYRTWNKGLHWKIIDGKRVWYD